MKTLAACLLLANALWFSWQQGWLPWEPPFQPALVRTAFQQAPQRLLMLGDLPEDQLLAMEQLASSRQARIDAGARMRQVEAELALLGQGLETAEDPVERRPWCASVGVFVESDAAQAYLDRLVLLGVGGQLQAREEAVSSTWWVHLPPFASEELARSTLAELQAKGIDSYYMRTGELAGGISLGVFSREESANVARQQLDARGYRTEIREIFRMEPRFYVEVELPDASLLDTPEVASLLGSGSGLQVLEKLCETIAQ